MERASDRAKVSGADTGVALPEDVVEDILLRVPARQLCRLRAVCRSWRSLLSGACFVKAHAALHPALILALATDKSRIDVVDLSGDVVKEIHVVPAAAKEGTVLPTRPGGPSFLFRANNHVRMVDPDTGAVFTLPFDGYDDPTPQRAFWSTTRADYVLGQDTSTGHHKVLRIVNCAMGRGLHSPFQQLCHVLTLAGEDENQQRQCWRECHSPQSSVKSYVDFPGVTIKGFVYFLTSYFLSRLESALQPYDAGRDKKAQFVVSFDLEKEQWSPTTLQGPSDINTRSGVLCQMKLVTLSNTLVVVHSYHSSIDLWFAQDLEKGLWVKKHSMQQELLAPTSSPEREFGISLQNKVKILHELDDGRIIFSYFVPLRQEAAHWHTRVYDPRSNICIELPQLDLCDIVGVYIESLLLGEMVNG